jgi:hypothetical protein
MDAMTRPLPPYRLPLLFIGAAVASFLAIAPLVGRSAVFTLAAQGCQQREFSDGRFQGVGCAIPAGTTSPTARLTGVWFNYVTTQPGGTYFGIAKRSYTGLLYDDYKSLSGQGFVDEFLYAKNVIENPDQWDYLCAYLGNDAGSLAIGRSYDVYGVAAVSN